LSISAIIAAASLDAVFDARGVARPEYQPVLEVLSPCSRSDLKVRQQRLRQAVDELDVQFSDWGPALRGSNAWQAPAAD
jgi:uncharacterized circularly permuted ATP-grasp superfamily protein